MHKGFILWFTGLSGSGKSTLAEKIIVEAIKQRISEPEQIAYVLQHVEEEIASSGPICPTR